MGNCDCSCKPDAIPSMDASIQKKDQYVKLKRLFDSQQMDRMIVQTNPMATSSTMAPIQNQNYKGYYDNVTGEAEGQGVYKTDDAEFQGVWKCGRPLFGKYNILKVKIKIQKNGHGRINWPDGKMYHGQLKNLLPDGSGRMTFVNGDYYEGEWQMGKYHGHGTYHWYKTGQKFIGMYERGERKYARLSLTIPEVPEATHQEEMKKQ